MNMNNKILEIIQNLPLSRESAIAALVEMEVARWGEQERAAAEAHHGGQTYGLALNAIVSRAEAWLETEFPAARKAARAALTPDDRAELRKGG